MSEHDPKQIISTQNPEKLVSAQNSSPNEQGSHIIRSNNNKDNDDADDSRNDSDISSVCEDINMSSGNSSHSSDFIPPSPELIPTYNWHRTSSCSSYNKSCINFNNNKSINHSQELESVRFNSQLSVARKFNENSPT